MACRNCRIKLMHKIFLLDSVNYTRCTNDTGCRFIENSQCDNGTDLCECQTGYTAEPDGMSCRESQLGDPCRSQKDCSRFIPSSVCDKSTKTCVCDVGYKAVPKTSYNSTSNVTTNFEECDLMRIGDSCSGDAECETAVPNSVCAQKKTDVTLLGQSEPSTNGTDANSTDSNSTVTTSSPMVTSAPVRTCTCAQRYTSASSNTSCQCLHTYQGKCLPVKIGSSPCTSDALCTKYIPNSRCVGRVCICARKYVAVDGGSACEERVLGSVCSNDSDCWQRLVDTICVNNVCVCDVRFISDANQTACAARKSWQ